jgi:(S)-2-hydroxyglutarate dehydrogenase
LKKRIGIVGAGILGLATAWKLQERLPQAEIMVFEKESAPGLHQSSHNSGVLHCGLYYQPGSLKARLAVEGIRTMVDFCRGHQIPHEICGKVVVASDERERRILENLAARGEQNGLKGLAFLGSGQLKCREPFVSATSALLVPEEGIVDFPAVMDTLASLIQQRGGAIFYNSHVGSRSPYPFEGPFVLETSRKEIPLDLLVCCAGLHADRLYRTCTGLRPPLKIIPFRGEYRMLRPEVEGMVNHLVYPVPDPAFPFLGVHFTRMVHGGREVGPNAVLALRREGYRKSSFSLRDTLDSLSYQGFRRFVSKNFRFTAGELASSFSDEAFLAKVRKMIPEMTLDQLVPGTAGVRAQALAGDGSLVMDFRIMKHGKQVHVLNAPSPGATASLAIASHIVDNYIDQS